MEENNCRGFILSNSLAAVSAVPFDNYTCATDGVECLIHRFELDGTSDDCIRTIRAYRRLRRNSDTCTTTALGCCNSNRLYFLTDNYIEQGYTELDVSCEYGCGCDCLCDDLSEVTDASVTVIGSDEYIVAAFRKSAYLFDMNGKRLTRLCVAEEDELLTDFIYPESGLFAMSTFRNNRFTITVSDNGTVHNAILERGNTLRMLIPLEDGIYGLFGRNYIYNRIIKIYSDGVLRLPTGRECI